MFPPKHEQEQSNKRLTVFRTLNTMFKAGVEHNIEKQNPEQHIEHDDERHWTRKRQV